MTRLLTEPPRPQGVREHRNAPWCAVASVCVGAFMGQLDASIVTLAFPALQREFHASLAATQWVSLAYLLALVGLRVVQAAGAAMLQANSVALVVTSVPRSRMRVALGMQAAAQALGLALGPTAGGLLVGSAGWRWVCWVSVPDGCVALVVGRYLLPRTRERAAVARFDWPGLLLLAGASAALLLAVSGVSGLGQPAWAVGALSAAAVAAAVGIDEREQRTTAPKEDHVFFG